MEEEKGQQFGEEKKPIIKDKFHITYIIHFILGAGNLVPWNSFVTAVDYFDYLYPNRHIDKVFSVAYMVSALSVLVSLVYLSNNQKKRLPSFRIRMSLAQSLFILALITPPLIEKIFKRKHTEVAFGILVFGLIICGLADGLTSGSLMGVTGELPGRYMQATITGNASSGLLVCVLRIVTKASLPHSPNGLRISTRIYFIVSASLVFLCLIFYNFRHKLTVVKYYSSSANHVSTHHHHDHDHNQNPPIIWDVVKSIRHAAFGIVILYVVTLSIFPGYLSENVKSRFFKDWYPILLIAIFNVGDFLGKFSTAFYVPQSIYKIMWICVGRVGFYPLFAACLFGPKWLRSEAPVIILTVGLGFSNGFFTGVLMILAPKSVAPQLSERAAIAMSMFLMTGLALGSFLGWLWNI